MKTLRCAASAAVPVLFALTLTACGATRSRQVEQPADTHASVSIDARRVVRPISPKLVGVHVPAWNETAYVNGNIDPRLLREMKRLGFTYLVFPGGAFGYDYNWKQPNLPAEITTAQFLSLGEHLGATEKISVNPNASPELAAEWVRNTKGRVRYWEVADEPYLHMSADAFIAKMRAFVPAMKRANPSIKIVTNISAFDPDFSTKVIREVGDLTDVWSIHFFPLSPTSYSANDKARFYADLLKTPQALADQFATVRSWVGAVYPHKRFEYQLGSWAPVTYGPTDWNVNALPDGLWAVDVYGVAATAGVDAAASWALMNPYPPGHGDFGLVSPNKNPYVIGDAAQLFANHFGTQLVTATSSSDQLSAYASLSNDRKKLYLLLVNKSPDQDASVDFSLDGFKPAGQAAAWILDGATNPTHLFDYGLRRELVHGISGSQFSWTVPSYAAVALEIPAASAAASLGAPPNLATDKVASASSTAFLEQGMPWHDDTFAAGMAVDDDPTTRWASDFFVKQPQWLQVDLGQAQPFDQVRLQWEYWSTAYDIQVSDDGTNWRTVATRSDAIQLKPEPQPIDEITLDEPVTARYVRISMTGRPAQSGSRAGASQWTPDGFSLWEVGVYLTR
jgi:hypothetical protein